MWPAYPTNGAATAKAPMPNVCVGSQAWPATAVDSMQTIAWTRSRESAAAGPDDRFRFPDRKTRAIALATRESSAKLASR